MKDGLCRNFKEIITYLEGVTRNMPKIELVTAIDLNGAIGLDNKLPWNCKEDLAFFQRLTKGHIVIMGRKTQESLPKRHLPGRVNLVVSKTLKKNPENCTAFRSRYAALWEACRIQAATGQRIFVIGGSQIYALFKDIVTDYHITRIHDRFEADQFFPFSLDIKEPFRTTTQSLHTSVGKVDFIHIQKIK